jgi:hypothetical protein
MAVDPAAQFWQKQIEKAARERGSRSDRATVWMFFFALAAVAGIFLGGLAILVTLTNLRAEGIVAILSPALAALGTLAGGVFGYSQGARGAAEASQTAAAATQHASAIERDATPLAREVKRITGQAVQGGRTERTGGKHEISEDDIRTLAAAAEPLMHRLGG